VILQIRYTGARAGQPCVLALGIGDDTPRRREDTGRARVGSAKEWANERYVVSAVGTGVFFPPKTVLASKD
jgi:hypothetical protein